MPRFSKNVVLKRFAENARAPEYQNVKEEMIGALKMLKAGQFDKTLESSFPDYLDLEKSLRELWKEQETGIQHSHRWAMKMAPNLKEVVRTCLTCGESFRSPL